MIGQQITIISNWSLIIRNIVFFIIMKKFLMMLIAVLTMSLAANATDYTGTVSNVQMGSKNPTVTQIITFSVEAIN